MNKRNFQQSGSILSTYIHSAFEKNPQLSKMKKFSGKNWKNSENLNNEKNSAPLKDKKKHIHSAFEKNQQLSETKKSRRWKNSGTVKD